MAIRLTCGVLLFSAVLLLYVVAFHLLWMDAWINHIIARIVDTMSSGNIRDALNSLAVDVGQKMIIISLIIIHFCRIIVFNQSFLLYIDHSCEKLLIVQTWHKFPSPNELSMRTYPFYPHSTPQEFFISQNPPLFLLLSYPTTWTPWSKSAV